MSSFSGLFGPSKKNLKLKSTENKLKYVLQNTYGNGHRDIKELNNYDYIIYILDLINILVKYHEYHIKRKSDRFLSISNQIKTNASKNIFNTKYINMESTLKLLICAVAYIKDIFINNYMLNDIYKDLLDITQVKDISQKMRIKIILNENDLQMRFLIALMGYIDAIMAKGKSEKTVQFGLKGWAYTLNDVKTIEYHLKPIQYLFGIHAGLLERYLKETDYLTGEILLKSKINNFSKNQINKYLNSPNFRSKKNKELENLNHTQTIKQREFINNINFDKKYGLNKISRSENLKNY